MRDRSLLYVSAAASLIYLVSAGWQPFPGSAVLKGIPVGGLALMAVRARGRRQDAGLLALALTFSTAGDVLLDIAPRFFVFGLAAFLLAHLTYIFLFTRNRSRQVRILPPRWAAVCLVVGGSVTLSAWIVPAVGGLAVPVLPYIAALTTMVSMAILGRFRMPWIAWGAILFLVSDSLLAIDRFRTPLPLRDYLVWSTYYLGQCGIALGYLASGTPSEVARAAVTT